MASQKVFTNNANEWERGVMERAGEHFFLFLFLFKFSSRLRRNNLVLHIISKLHCRNHCTTRIILLMLMRHTVWSLTGSKEQ